MVQSQPHFLPLNSFGLSLVTNSIILSDGIIQRICKQTYCALNICKAATSKIHYK